MEDTKKNRLPFDKRPMPNPGRSLERQIVDVVFDKILAWIMMATFCVIFAAVEWTRWAVGDTFRPVIYSLLTGGWVAFTIWKVRRSWRELEDLKTGLLGEIHTGQFLQNKLLRKGYWVIHDIPLEGLNIDHAIIGPGGVFAIETKTRTKARGGGGVKYDGERVLVNGMEPDRDPIAQAKAVARKLEDILLKRKAMKVFVRPVVLFPGWYVEKQPKGAEVWVLNEDAFVQFADKEQPSLTKQEVFELAAAVGMHVRDWMDKTAT